MTLNDYPIDALLRPPVELYSACLFGGCAAVSVLSPWAFMMTPEIGYVSGAGLAFMSYIRGEQAYRVLKYQKNMRRLPFYALKPQDIPVSNKKMFIGKGFRWTQRHTQRLKDTQRPDVQHYVTPSPLFNWVRTKEIVWEHNVVLNHFSKLTSANKWWNPVRPYPPVGGKPQLHAVEPDEHDVYSDLGERVGHTLCLGTTRVGKTRFAEVLITQDIHRGSNKYKKKGGKANCVIVFDPKGDAALLRRMYIEAKRTDRLDKFYVFDLGHPEISARYNPVGDYGRITEVASRTSRQLPGEGQSATFREFVWRYVNVIAKAMSALGRRIDYDAILNYGQDIEPLLIDYLSFLLENKVGDEWSNIVDQVKGRFENKEIKVPRQLQDRTNRSHALIKVAKDYGVVDSVAGGLIKTFEYDKAFFDKLVASLLPLMEKLTSGKVAELISPDYLDPEDDRPIFDWKQIISTDAICYCSFAALQDPEVASAVGNSMFADLTSTAGMIYSHGLDTGLPSKDGKADNPNICIHADEFNELMGDEFIPLLNKAGGSGYQVTAYTQTWSDVEAKVGSKAKAGQVAGNFNSLIMLRVKEKATAEMLTDHLPKVEIQTLMAVSGSNDSSDPGSDIHFTSRNEDRISVTNEPMLETGDVMSLPKGQAFALLEGGHLWKVRMPLPDDSGDDDMPEDLMAIMDDMKSQYRTSDNWWQISDHSSIESNYSRNQTGGMSGDFYQERDNYDQPMEELQRQEVFD